MDKKEIGARHHSRVYRRLTGVHGREDSRHRPWAFHLEAVECLGRIRNLSDPEELIQVVGESS
jgi:hypothetical protein